MKPSTGLLVFFIGFLLYFGQCEVKKCPEENGPIETILGIPGNCTHFIKCDFGVPKVELCPPGTTFNHYLIRCDFPDVSKCVPGETGIDVAE